MPSAEHPIAEAMCNLRKGWPSGTLAKVRKWFSSQESLCLARSVPVQRLYATFARVAIKPRRLQCKLETLSTVF